ncbi:MAG TPA: PEGA domain-containing protein [Methanomicrobiales archaeon]|nr:PEGA domain-containing protein [Methanomicrobiales archaeon]
MGNCRYLAAIFLAIAVIPFHCMGVTIGGDVGYYLVDSSPSGADVHFDGQYQGTTPVTIQVYSSGTPGHTISVSMAGYQTWTQSLPGNPAAGETVPIMAVLVPLVRYGSFSITSDPSGAAIYLNGNYQGTAPLTIPNLVPGTYTLRADYSGYEPGSITDNVIAGQVTVERFTLRRILRSGSVTVISTPSGAYIYMDGEYEGRTPLTVSDITPGTHTIELDASGFYDWKTTVSVTDGSSQVVTATLSPIPVTASGWIEISSKPGGASILLDGVPKGLTPAQGARTLDNVLAGDHTVKLQLAGYQDYTTMVNVKGSTTSYISASLSPTPISTVTPATGTLSVASAPSGANVLVDNVFRGVSPVTLDGIPPGTRTVKLQLSGYRDWSMEIQVQAGIITPVNAVLESVPSPQPTKSGILPLGALAALALLLVFRKRVRDLPLNPGKKPRS